MEDKIEKTRAFLFAMHEAGYHMVTIGKPDEKNPACRTWLNGPLSVWPWHPSFEGFRNGKTDRDACKLNRWPASWEISRKYIGSGGCGNGHQHQIKSNESVIYGTFSTKSKSVISRQINRIAENLFLDLV